MRSGSSLKPAEVDARALRQRLTLGSLRGSIPRRCYRIRPLFAWLTLIRILTMTLIGLWLLSRVQLAPGPALGWQLPVLALLWLYQGWVLVGLFVLGHDCGHGVFSRRRWVNNLVGNLCMAPLANGFRAWQLTHDHHHAHTQTRDQEVDWAVHLRTRDELEAESSRVVRLGYALPLGVLFWIVWNMFRRIASLRAQLGVETWKAQRRHLLASTVLLLAVLSTLYGGLWWMGGWWAVFKYHAIPASISMLTGSFIITVQHASRGSLMFEPASWTPVRGQIVSTFDVRFPRLLEFLWCDVSLHVTHHVAPAVPWYHLREASRALRSRFPDLYQSRRFAWRDILLLWRTPLLHRTRSPGTYELVFP